MSSRARVMSVLDGPWRIALVVAPPGYGKTEAVMRWARAAPVPVVWHDLSADDHHDRTTTWLAVIGRARSALGDGPTRLPRTGRSGRPDIDDLLREFADHRPDDAPIVLVFDRADDVEDPAFWVDLDRLVERAGDGLRIIVIARSAAAIPAGRWRASGLLVDIGPDDLTYRPDAEMRHASRRLDAILRGIDPVHRRNALRLAVPHSFDSELAVIVAGPGAGDSAIHLARRGLLERDGDRRRFDPALRRLLLDELRRLDAAELRRLQTEAAKHLARNGDLSSAYRALAEAGELDAAGLLAAQPALERARAGDQAGVDRALAALPAPATVDEPGLATAVAATCLLCVRLGLAAAWVERIDELDVPPDGELSLRRRLVRAHLRFLQGDLPSAERELAGLDESPLSALERVALVGVGVRVALGQHQTARARQLLTTAPDGTAHRRLERDALTAWCDVLDGDVASAARLLHPVVTDIEHRGGRPDQAVLDATVTAAWAAYLGGDVATANRYAVVALGDADRLRCDWNLLRAGSVAVTTLLQLNGPAAARSLLIETRLRRRGGPSPLDAELDEADVSILRALGRLDEARALLDRLADSPRVRVLRASMEIAESGALSTAGLLEGSATWPAGQRVVAAVLRSVDDPRAVSSALGEARRLGLVMPLIGHGPAVDAALARLPLGRLHPRLAELLHAAPLASVATLPRSPSEALTARERTVLALLPSHLTYEQIAERLSLSVNTVKSNLKSIYRKLSVSSRSDAVDTARAARLV